MRNIVKSAVALGEGGRKTLLAVMIGLVGFSTHSLAEIGPIMGLDEVKTGMIGTGKTVYTGVEPDSFGFEILGRTKFWIASTDIPIYVARMTSGPVGFPPEKTQIVAGMSGSPCYINGRLVGALSYGFAWFSKDPIFGITPIELMINPFELVKGGAKPSGSPGGPGGLSGLKPLPIPLYFPNSLKFVLDKTETGQKIISEFREKGFLFVSRGAGDNQSYNQNYQKASLKPGSAINVDLVRGDITIGAGGTVTAIDGKTIWAFGHPFFNFGQVNLPFQQAQVITIISSYMNSYKLHGDDVSQNFGTIEEDYYTAVKGTFGKKAEMILLKIILEGERGKKEINCSIARISWLTPSLIRTIIYWTLIDGYSEVERPEAWEKRNAYISTGVFLKGQERPLSLTHSYNFEPGRQNFAYADGYVEGILREILGILYLKGEMEKLEKVELKIKFDQYQEPFRLENLRPDVRELRPGQTVNIGLALKRNAEEIGGKDEWIKTTFPFRIPEGVRAGNVHFEVKTGELLSILSRTEDRPLKEICRDLSVRSNTRLFLKAQFIIGEEPTAPVDPNNTLSSGQGISFVVEEPEEKGQLSVTWTGVQERDYIEKTKTVITEIVLPYTGPAVWADASFTIYIRGRDEPREIEFENQRRQGFWDWFFGLFK